MGDEKHEKPREAPPREPIIVEVPTVLSRIQAQLRRESRTGEWEGPPSAGEAAEQAG